MTLNKAKLDFLKHHDIDDIKTEIIGELNEYSNEHYSAYYGNGELIIYLNNGNDDHTTYIIDRIGFNEYLSEY